jgi:hypothetical protein
MHLRRGRVVLLCLVTVAGICGAKPLSAQAAPAFTLVSASSPRINFLLFSTSQHSSVTGWSTVWTPDILFRLNSRLYVDANVPWYLSVKNYVFTATKNGITYPLKQTEDVIGDTTVTGHYQYQPKPKDFCYRATTTVGFPTGNSQYGLSANVTSYFLDNHLEHPLGPFRPDIEIGEGNSSNILHTLAKKSYTAVGQFAYFQAGSIIDLPKKIIFDVEAFELLPIGNQNVYGTITKKASSGKTVTTKVLLGKGVAEDNGFNTELDIPLGEHFVLAGNYQRSIIQGTDLAGITIVWKLRAPKKTISIDSLIPDF